MNINLQYRRQYQENTAAKRSAQRNWRYCINAVWKEAQKFKKLKKTRSTGTNLIVRAINRNKLFDNDKDPSKDPSKDPLREKLTYWYNHSPEAAEYGFDVNKNSDVDNNVKHLHNLLNSLNLRLAEYKDLRDESHKIRCRVINSQKTCFQKYKYPMLRVLLVAVCALALFVEYRCLKVKSLWIPVITELGFAGLGLLLEYFCDKAKKQQIEDEKLLHREVHKQLLRNE